MQFLMDLEFVSEDVLDSAVWAKQAEFWWIHDRYHEIFRWTWYIGEPPKTPAMNATPRIKWRHPTFEEANERQQYFNTASREDWDKRTGYGGYNAESLKRVTNNYYS